MWECNLRILFLCQTHCIKFIYSANTWYITGAFKCLSLWMQHEVIKDCRFRVCHTMEEIFLDYQNLFTFLGSEEFCAKLHFSFCLYDQWQRCWCDLFKKSIIQLMSGAEMTLQLLELRLLHVLFKKSKATIIKLTAIPCVV